MRFWVCCTLLFCMAGLWAEDEPEGRKYAFLVGVQKYDGTDLGNLKYCENDVDQLADVLKSEGYRYNRVVLLTRGAAIKDQDRDDILPTAENIRVRLNGMLRDLRARDTVVVAFAGHGVQMKADGKMYFCPAKCNLSKLDTLISIDDIYATLGECKARNKVLLVDACRNDPMASREAGKDERINSVTLPLIPDPPGGTVAMFSCSKGQVARESDKHTHGYMFKFVIEGLKGDPQAVSKTGDVGWLKLAAFVADEVRDKVKEDYGDQVEQTPEVKGESRNMVLGKLAVAPRSLPSNLNGNAIATGPATENELSLSLGGGVKMELIRIKAGTFTMGSPESGPNHDSSERHHLVTISKDFYMGKYAVTQEQYEAVMGTNPSCFTSSQGGGPRNPVEQVSWNDAVEFCQKLSAKSGKSIKLPTEAQWEYACRAGTTGPFNFSGPISTDKVNYDGNYTYDGSAKGEYRHKTTPVGNFQPNRWGLYDMHGNVYQWCTDWYGDYSSTSETDPQGAATGMARVLRGGSWRLSPYSCRSAGRNNLTPDAQDLSIGFRIVLSLN